MTGSISYSARLPEGVRLVEGLLPETLAARENLSVTYSHLSCWRDTRSLRSVPRWFCSDRSQAGITGGFALLGFLKSHLPNLAIFRCGFCNLYMVP